MVAIGVAAGLLSTWLYLAGISQLAPYRASESLDLVYAVFSILVIFAAVGGVVMALVPSPLTRPM